MEFHKNKLVIVGAGMVGSAVLNTVLSLGLFAEIVMIDKNREKARGEALDSSHTTSFAYSPNVFVHDGDYEDCAGAQMIVITAGATIKPGDESEDRTSLAAVNTRIMTEILRDICKYTRDAILVMVSNPLDIMTYLAQNRFGYDPRRVIGTGTLLDTARLRRIIAREYGVDTKNVHGYVLGEHGKSCMIDWSLVNIAGIPLEGLAAAFGGRKLDRGAVLNEVVMAGYEVLKLKGSTSAGVAMSVARILKAVALNEESVLPVSTTLQGEYGVRDVALSIPCIITSEGIGRRLELPLAPEELEKLRGSASVLAGILDELGLRGKA